MKQIVLTIILFSTLNAEWDQSLDRWEMDCNYNNATACSIAASMYRDGKRVVFENNINITHKMKKNISKAIKLYKKACRLGDKLACKELKKLSKSDKKIDPKKNWYEINNIAIDYMLKKDYPNALKYINKALEISKNNNLGPINITSDIINKGTIYVYLKRCKEAQKLFKEALNIIKKHNLDYANVLNTLGSAYACNKEYEKAKESLQKAREILEKRWGANYPFRGIVTENLAEVYSKEKKYDLAKKYYNEALNIYKKSLGKNHNNVKRVIKSLDQLNQKK